MRIRASSLIRWLAVWAVVAAAAFAGPARAQTPVIYVSETGSDDTGNGTVENPFASISRALQVPSSAEIWLQSGQYLIGSNLIIPPNRVIRGGFKPVPGPDGPPQIVWGRDSEPTLLLALGVSGLPSVTMRERSQMEWVTVVGGFYSMELLPGARISEVTFLGGQHTAILARSGQADLPAIVERCRVQGGGGGIRVEGNANLVVLETMTRNTQGRGFFATGTGIVGVYHSVFQRGQTDGMAVFGNSTVLIENCVVRRNTGNGIRIAQAAPIVRGCLVELNATGISLLDSTAASVENCTVVNNRRSGISMRLGQPDLRSNIIAHNKNYGVFEDKPDPIIEYNDDGTTTTITFETHGGDLTNNLFWDNAPAHYFDEEDSVYTDEADLNLSIVNLGDVEGNIVSDPVFVNREQGNYRLAGDSPAIDLVAAPQAFDRDLDGNSRLVDTGEDGGDVMDLGAFEFQTRAVRNLAAEYGDRNLVPDILNPGQFVERVASPEWEFTELSRYTKPVVEFLPGRLRMWPQVNETFGAIFRKAQDTPQPSDKLLIVRPTAASNAPSGIAMSRFRVNGPQALDVVAAHYYLGTRELAPTPEGRQYEFIADMRQGGYRSVPFAEFPLYETGFNIDVIEWLNLPNHSPIDYTGFEVEIVERELFNAQFTHLIREWSFARASEVDWTPEGISVLGPNELRDPLLRYNSSRQALELTANQHMTFGWWKSPGIPIKAGAYYKIDIRVSTPQEPRFLAPWFRLRTSTTFFELSDELIVQTFGNGLGAPTPAGETYTLYGRMPADLIPVYESDMIELVLYMDFFGLFDDRPAATTLYLEEVRVWASDN